MRLDRLSGLMLAVLLAVGGMPAAGKDVFTPLTGVPFNPSTTPVPGTDGKCHFVYELELANTRSAPATLEEVKVITAPPAETDKPAAARFRPPAEPATRVLARFGPSTFPDRLKQLDNRAAVDAKLELNATRLFLLDLAVDKDDIPAQLRHVLRLTGQGLDVTNPKPVEQSYSVATIDVTRHLPVLGPPLEGDGWVAFNGCCRPGAHRSTALPVNGQLHFAQRFAIDWMRLDDQGRLRNGPVSDVRSFAGYGARVLAIADGTVVSTLDGLPDQIPPNNPDPSTITLENIDGNHVVLDIGHGLYAFYAHLKPGSVRVKVGQKVRTGTVVGLLGNTGNSGAPHLHFHIMDSASVLGSEGLPYVYRRFKLAGNFPTAALPDDFGGSFKRYLHAPQQRTRQFPLDGDVIEFPR